MPAATLQFPKQQYWKVLGTSELWNGGGYSFAGVQRIGFVRLTMLSVGTPVGAEEFRIAIYNDAALTSRYAVSDWRALADVEAAAGLSTFTWRADVRFDFPTKPFVELGRQYFMALESQNYVRDSSYFYVGFLLDWPFPANNPNANPLGDDLRRGLKAEFYNEQRIGFA